LNRTGDHAPSDLSTHGLATSEEGLARTAGCSSSAGSASWSCCSARLASFNVEFVVEVATGYSLLNRTGDEAASNLAADGLATSEEGFARAASCSSSSSCSASGACGACSERLASLEVVEIFKVAGFQSLIEELEFASLEIFKIIEFTEFQIVNVDELAQLQVVYVGDFASLKLDRFIGDNLSASEEAGSKDDSSKSESHDVNSCEIILGPA